MSSYVVDTSIVIQFLIRDAHTTETRNLFQKLGKGDELIIPEFCILECTNVLWKHVRFQGMPQSNAEALTEDLLRLPLKVASINNLLKDALKLGLRNQLAVYDSIYIALAKQFGYPLITDDARQANAAQAEGIQLKPIADF